MAERIGPVLVSAIFRLRLASATNYLQVVSFNTGAVSAAGQLNIATIGAGMVDTNPGYAAAFTDYANCIVGLVDDGAYATAKGSTKIVLSQYLESYV